MSNDSVTWSPAYVAIGSNQDNPLQRVREAFGRLDSIDGVRVILQSHIYRSPPLGTIAQPDFYNAVAGVLTTFDPHQLLTALKALEHTLGRAQPIERWGPRVIDFDLILFGQVRLQTDTLVVPHPGTTQRSFVLVPLAEIAPTVSVPGAGRVEQLAAQCDRNSLERIDA